MPKRKDFLSIVSVLIILLLPVFAQGQEIRFSKDNITVGEAFKEIEKQTDYLISYSIRNFNLNRDVKLTTQQLPLEQAMVELLANLNYTSKIRGHHILIIPDIEEAKPESEFALPTKKMEMHGGIIDLEKLQKELNAKDQEYVDQVLNEPVFDINKYQRQREYQDFINGRPEYVSNLPKVALRTNLLYGLGVLTPNAGVEIGLNQKSTLLINGSYNAWKAGSDNKKLWHWTTSAEYRYWLCERFNGHFLGAHGFYSNYNISGKNIPMVLKKDADNYRHDGYAFGAGVSYGYQFMLSKNWNLELNAGIGVGVLKYDKWESQPCGGLVEKDLSRTFVAPTKLGVTLMYLIK